MFVRQVKRKCGVRGCKNTDCFAISRTREAGGSVIICKSCLGQALEAIDEINPKTKSNIPTTSTVTAPALFFNAKALGTDTDAKAEASNSEDGVQGGTVTGSDSEDDLGDTEKNDAESGEKEQDKESEDGDASSDEPAEESCAAYVCPKCGKAFATERGLNSHMRACKAPTAEA